MKRIDRRAIPDIHNEIRGFMVVRNEALRLPSTLRHHRSIGIRRFFVLDNGSSDGTIEYLLSEPDVHVFSTTERYSQSRYGITWTNELLNNFGTGHWTLTTDADEQFIYPYFEEIGLQPLCEYLDRVGAEAVPCLLLDMYSDVAIANTVHRPDKELIETCSYFDRAPYRMTRTDIAPNFEIYGGVRERIFMYVNSQFHPPTISKVPLVKWKLGMSFKSSTHSLIGARVASILAALFHFKFLSDFHERAQNEVARGEHFAGAREYKAYLQFLHRNNAGILYCDKTAKFRNSSQLVELGLMSAPQSYHDYIKLIAARERAAVRPGSMLANASA